MGRRGAPAEIHTGSMIAPGGYAWHARCAGRAGRCTGGAGLRPGIGFERSTTNSHTSGCAVLEARRLGEVTDGCAGTSCGRRRSSHPTQSPPSPPAARSPPVDSPPRSSAPSRCACALGTLPINSPHLFPVAAKHSPDHTLRRPQWLPLGTEARALLHTLTGLWCGPAERTHRTDLCGSEARGACHQPHLRRRDWSSVTPHGTLSTVQTLTYTRAQPARHPPAPAPRASMRSSKSCQPNTAVRYPPATPTALTGPPSTA